MNQSRGSGGFITEVPRTDETEENKQQVVALLDEISEDEQISQDEDE